MKIITKDQINKILPSIDILPEIEQGFKAYSEGRAVIPPVGEMILDKGEVHIKYGYITGDKFYVIKVASGFYGNPELGLPSSNGLLLLFSQVTGELACVLLDEGHLTDIRTAVAGAIAAKYLAPEEVTRIGIVGTGIQARLQLQYLKEVVACRQVMVWGRGHKQLNSYKAEMEKLGFNIETTLDPSYITEKCNLIVSTTPSKVPLLQSGALMKGTHITAVGSDTKEKQELAPSILKNADLVVADSIKQCLERGEIFKAMEAGLLKEEDLTELGHIISGSAEGRTSDRQLTVADLTGVAVQDLKIASAIYRSSTD